MEFSGQGLACNGQIAKRGLVFWRSDARRGSSWVTPGGFGGAGPMVAGTAEKQRHVELLWATRTWRRRR